MAKTWQDSGKEWLDTFVVAISVAMCFRAYFYEPFNIPTGSMQPTLWGYHTEAAKPGEGGAFDMPVLSFFKFILTGETYKEFRAPWSGRVKVLPRNDGRYDVMVVNSMHRPDANLRGVRALWRWLAGLVAENCYDNYAGIAKIPTDAMDFRSIDGAQVGKGDLLWCGRVKKGDFIFVNRWLWNFRRPRDGDVMIFSTTGIPALVQGTHYIKRMKATPGERYVIEHPVEGGAREVVMGEGEYFACGDNFNNSFDSRYWGPVPAGNLRGIGSAVFWPFSGWRIIR